MGRHLNKYETIESDLLVFSEQSGRLYGFDQFAASLFSLLETDKSADMLLLETFESNEAVKSLITTMTKLLNGIESEDEEKNDPFELEYPVADRHIQFQNPFYYRLNTFTFVIDTEERWIIEKVLPSLAHLKDTSVDTSSPALAIVFEKKQEGYSIFFNDKVIIKGLAEDALLPRLMDYIRIAYYHSTDYLISLHAAALYFKETPLILPAVSGSGKSTLSTYLMECGFAFLTDEVALIDAEECMKAIPMSITLKEGSWNVLEKEGVTFDALSVHKRFDGQKLRFLPPKNVPQKSLKVAHAFLIFPQYKKGVQTEVKRLSTLETLAHITSSGYEVKDSYDWHAIHRWIELIEGFQKFTITYSDLEDARINIERLMSK